MVASVVPPRIRRRISVLRKGRFIERPGTLAVDHRDRRGRPGRPVSCRTRADRASIAGGRRHLGLVTDAVTGETLAWPSPPQRALPTIAARRGSPVCVVASGDPFFYGIGSLLARTVPPAEMICLPGISAFSLAANRFGW